MVTIQVSPDIAAKIRFLAESGVFTLNDGSVTCHFKDGKLKTIKTELFTYAPTYAHEELLTLP